MCADGKNAYREQGYTPRPAKVLWEASPMNPKNRKEKKQSTGTEFLERYVR